VLTQEQLFEPIPAERLALIPHEELVKFTKAQQKVIEQMAKHIKFVEARNEELKQRRLKIEEEFVTIKNKLFGKSSERSKLHGKRSEKRSPRGKRVQLPSERYPHLPLIERHIELETLPSCGSCGSQMSDSGMTEDSEFLTVLPAEYFTILQRRHKYRCQRCHSDVKTAPAPPRVKPQSGYSDEMIIDVALSKYCDLIPIDRYCKIASRSGLKGIPPNSLIQLTHYLADFLKCVYEDIRKEVLSSLILHADETPHRMLERGGGKVNWYLWGFSSKGKASYYEVQDTRSGDVASRLLMESSCTHLMSDVFSGYSKAVKDSNEGRPSPIVNIYCNAHARRKFKEAEKNFAGESEYYLRCYRLIYRLEKWPLELKRLRQKKLYKAMQERAIEDIGVCPARSSIEKAQSYFLKNFTGLTEFTNHESLPIDNNLQERQLRSPVVGRKTWYGTHSPRGSETAAILFTLVESCKLVGINPREYFPKLVQRIHQGKTPLTPYQYSQNK
jgi:transposase